MTYLEALKILARVAPFGTPCAAQVLSLSRDTTQLVLQHLHDGGWLIRTDADLWDVPWWVTHWLKRRRNVAQLGVIHGHTVLAVRVQRFGGWVWVPVVDGERVDEWKVTPVDVKAWAHRALNGGKSRPGGR